MENPHKSARLRKRYADIPAAELASKIAAINITAVDIDKLLRIDGVASQANDGFIPAWLPFVVDLIGRRDIREWPENRLSRGSFTRRLHAVAWTPSDFARLTGTAERSMFRFTDPMPGGYLPVWIDMMMSYIELMPLKLLQRAEVRTRKTAKRLRGRTVSDIIGRTPIDGLKLPQRTKTALKRAGISYVDELKAADLGGIDELIGTISIDKIKEALIGR